MCRWWSCAPFHASAWASRVRLAAVTLTYGDDQPGESKSVAAYGSRYGLGKPICAPNYWLQGGPANSASPPN